nr:MAG TPA: Aconitase X swivel domain [Caudoviricetes sp.]
MSSGVILPSFWGGLVPDEGQVPARQHERRKRRG